MIAVAGVIYYMYVLPTFEAIELNQQTTADYRVELDKVKSVNELLASQLARVEAITLNDQTALERYLPMTIDDVEALKELNGILNSLSLEPTTLTYDGPSEPVTDAGLTNGYVLIPHSFSLSVDTTYTNLKALLSTVETSDYLLEVKELIVTPQPGGEVTADVTLVRYVLATAEVPADATAAVTQ